MKGSGISGQAVFEGVMIKNGGKYAVAVRKPDNDIDVVVENLKSISEKNSFLRFPFIRGIVRFAEEIYLGLKNFSVVGEYYDKNEELHKANSNRRNMELLLLIALISLAIGIFIVLPLGISPVIGRYITSDTLLILIEGAIRLVLLILYVAGLSLLPDVKRLYMYTGAEHKVMNCIDKGLPLTVSNVRRMSRKNYKCGTVFIINVIAVSLILFMFVRFENILLRIIFRLLLLPVVAGITDEIMRLASKGNNPVAVLFNIPGFIIHSLITDEPADEMIEVAIESGQAVCAEEKVNVSSGEKKHTETDRKAKRLKSGIKRVSKEKLAGVKKKEKSGKSGEQNIYENVNRNIEDKSASSKQIQEDEDDEILNALNHFFNSKKEEDKYHRGKRK